MAEPTLLQINIGATVECRGRSWRVTHVPASDYIFATDIETGSPAKLTIDEITRGNPPPAKAEAIASVPDLTDFSETEWSEAKRRRDIIAPLVGKPRRTRAMVHALASDHAIGAATIYRWLLNYEQSLQLSSLIPERRGPKTGMKKLDDVQEMIVKAVIEEYYLTKQRAKPADLIKQVRLRCRKAKVESPSENTIRRRVAEVPTLTMMKRRGQREAAANKFRPILGKFPGADQPLSIVQMDHTLLDVVVVDDTYRRHLGRPFITVVFDVFSRTVLGIYVSMEAAGAAASGMCLTNAILPKDSYLEALGVPGKWPTFGLPQIVHTDNAKEFRGNVLKHAFAEYGIDLQLRPAKTPHFGGHIERFMSRIADLMATLPGTTFSNPKARKGYNSEAEAVLSLREVEFYIVDFIVNIYHQEFHEGILMAPLHMWNAAIDGDDLTPGIGTPRVPADADKLRLDFLPFEMRTVQKYGIVIENVFYYHEVLTPWIGAIDPDTKAPRKFVVRYDPRDMSRVHFFDPVAKCSYPIPYRDTSHPKISLWSLRRARADARSRGLSEIDEATIFAAYERQAEIKNAAAATSKAARRDLQRRTSTKAIATAATPPGGPAIAIMPPPPPKLANQDADLAGLLSGSKLVFDEIEILLAPKHEDETP